MSGSHIWTGTLTARSSIAHGGQTRGTSTLLRRELIAVPGGELRYVPMISGNTLRGRLRRIGEELLRDVLEYDGLLSPSAAHALRGGGSLAKSSHEPLSGSRLQRLRNLVPQVGIFGAAGGGTIIGGALDVGKVVPLLAETVHITGIPTDRSAFTATQLESYTRQSDVDAHDFTGVVATEVALTFDATGHPDVVVDAGSRQMLFHVETFPAGTSFHTWLRLRRPTPLELAFFVDVLDRFRSDGRLGGRIAIGHGQVEINLACEPPAKDLIDWRDEVSGRRREVLDALATLT